MYSREIVACCALVIICIGQAAIVPDPNRAGTRDKAIIESTTDKEAVEKPDFLDINKGLKGLIDGDIVPRKSTTRNTITDQSLFWPSTTIPMNYGLGLSLEAIGSIVLARQEYHLRTCLNFVDRTNENDYVNFRSLSGCYSSVGRVGGSQTISIGSGCERIGTVCHEMMHAIGIWHEQSRPDRDDYVEIMWDDITPGYESNFNKYDYDVADPRRVPYDYTSVMHYSQSGFSETGNPTIVTRDPDFQDVIGQRNGFSKGDTEKINRMYQCSDTLLYTYNCNFDDESVCGYANDYADDDIDWIPYAIGENIASVPTSAPSFDATVGEVDKGAYLVLDTSAKTAGLLGETKSMRFLTKSSQQCLQFSYFISKDSSSDAAITVELGAINDQTGEITSSSSLIILSDDTSGMWAMERFTISAPSAYRLVFKGKTAAYQDTFAIDDVNVMDKSCDDGYFVTNDYSQVLADYPKGASLLSPVMTSTQGYNFRVKMYPQGSSSAADGYMSMYIGLVQGPNDDTLDWPFCNKYLRIMVVDQNDNPLYAMSRSTELVTSQSAGGDLWNKPTSDTSAGYYGYRNFMKISDLQTNNYLKLDRLVVSVLVQDMNWVNNEVCTGSFTRSVNSPIPMKMSVEDPNGAAKSSNKPDRDDDDEYKKDDREDQAIDEDHDGYMTIGAAVGMTIGVAFFVFLSMSIVMCCVTKTYKREAKHMQNTIVVHPHTQSPPAYSEENVNFDKLPLPTA